MIGDASQREDELGGKTLVVVGLGQIGGRLAELAKARRLEGGNLFSSIARLKAHPGAWWGVPETRALFEATYFAGLRKAGMPEE